MADYLRVLIFAPRAGAALGAFLVPADTWLSELARLRLYIARDATLVAYPPASAFDLKAPWVCSPRALPRGWRRIARRYVPTSLAWTLDALDSRISHATDAYGNAYRRTMKPGRLASYSRRLQPQTSSAAATPTTTSAPQGADVSRGGDTAAAIARASAKSAAALPGE